MKSILKNNRIFLIILIFSVILAGCNDSIGMGVPVDVEAPSITILTPHDGQWIHDVKKGEPVTMSGTWSDDKGVSQILVYVKEGNKYVTAKAESIQIKKDNTWTLKLYLADSGSHSIRVVARDSIKNEGKDEVNVNVELQDPLIVRSTILRKLEGGLGNPSEIFTQNKEYYSGILPDIYYSANAYEKIESRYIDEFQNESFTLKVQYGESFSGIAASRLWLRVEMPDGTVQRLSEDHINPDPGSPNNWPEWTIKAEDLIYETDPNNPGGGKILKNPEYEKGPHFIEFEIMAWNQAYWDPVNNKPVPGAEKPNINNKWDTVKGVLWYPESDIPHIKVNLGNQDDDDMLSSEALTIITGSELRLSAFDDDRLSEIYAGFISREDFDNLRGVESEEDYIASLSSNSARRNGIIAFMQLQNLFNPSAADPLHRQQTVSVGAGETPGEFRLIAMVKDAKGPYTGIGTSRDIWSVHPLLRVHIRNSNEPIIIVSNPVAENIFPELSGTYPGTKFKMSGYTIDETEVLMVQIAWIPLSAQSGGQIDYQGVYNALNTAAGEVMNPGQKTTKNGYHIFRVGVSQKEPVILNNKEYSRNNFEYDFDILDDFPGEASDAKLFVINAINHGTPSYKTFRMGGYKTLPALSVLYPSQQMQIHDTKEDLVLHMRATAAHGIGFNNNALIITDITAPANSGFVSPDPASSPGEKVRKITKEFIQSDIAEGSQRTYRFEATDILGNQNYTERTVIMSNIPTLLYINSVNGPGTYGIDEILRFEAVFSTRVKVEGTPRLKLYFSNPNNGEPAITTNPKNGAYATYLPGDDLTHTLVFTYKVLSGDNAPTLYTSLTPIDLSLAGTALVSPEETTSGVPQNANITFSSHDDRSLQSRALITLDGLDPTIEMAWFKQSSGGTGASYYNNGKIVTLELRTSEQVQVSGAPRAYISYSGGVVSADFSSLRHEGTKSVLEFTYLVNLPATITQTQLAWTSQWIRTSTGSAMTLLTDDRITDMAGNLINLTSLPTGNNLNGTSENKTAYIITQPPNPPTLTIHNTSGGAAVADNPRLANTQQFLRATVNPTTATTNQLWYSLRGGISPSSAGNNTFVAIPDASALPNTNLGYTPSEYSITAWQVDLAGNTSALVSPERSVVINSRAPELEAISCGQNNGSYPQGSTVTFRLHFSRPVRYSGTGTPILTLVGTSGGNTGTMTINMASGANTASSSIFTFERTVPANLRMSDIKVTNITLPGVTDEYGNAMPSWTSNTTVTTTNRNITTASTFNLNRPALHIMSVAPRVTSWSPVAPTATGSGLNGAIMTAGLNNTITLTFDSEVWEQAGGLITVKPYGRWALPPILTTEELDALSKIDYGANQTEYERRLRYIDDNGLPIAPYANRNQYNFYVRNTNGLVNTGGIRPDTSAKWVLGFQHDLFGEANEQRLRDVFNAAKWKWQEISSTSGSVVINTANRRLVTVKLRDLEPGRIWEVTVSAGAFRDAAGNNSEAVAAGVYRFWSAGTAAPVIRVDKFSHGDHYQGEYAIRGTNPHTTIPKIDTRVRIDSETPGASIRYDVVRTRYVVNNAFSSIDTTNAFFSHGNVPGTAPAGGQQTHDAGYNNNTIGNGGMHLDTHAVIAPPVDNNGYFTGLLVPIEIQGATSTAIPISQNGAITQANLTAMGTTLTGGGGINYRAVAQNGTITRASPVFQGRNLSSTVFTNYYEHYFYAGDAYTSGTGAEANATVTDKTDSRLYTGRRDYIAAIAEKNQVDSGAFAGDALTASTVAYEGVYKTTILFRDFSNRSTRFVIQGTDKPTIPTVPGFPLRISYTDTPPGITDTALYNAYFNRQSYRTSGTLPTTNDNDDPENNYIWVSWDIVSDWYLMGRGFITNNNGFMERRSYNYNGILATYGAVTYRYRQYFTNSGATESTTMQNGSFEGPSR